MTTAEAAERVRYTISRVNQLVRWKYVRELMVGGVRFVRVQDLREYREGKRRQSTGHPAACRCRVCAAKKGDDDGA